MLMHNSVQEKSAWKAPETTGSPKQTVDVVSAYVANNNVRTEDLANLINTVRAALSNSGATAAAPEKPQAPMSWKKAIKPDGIVSFEDGKSYKSMKRHLTRYGLTPQQYREKWGLPKDFAMVAPNYAAARSVLAKKLGLGTKGQAARNRRAGQRRARRRRLPLKGCWTLTLRVHVAWAGGVNVPVPDEPRASYAHNGSTQVPRSNSL